MVKAQNDIKSAIKMIDVVVEVLDARIPLSSQNPIIDELSKDKERIVVLNKADLADEIETKKWIDIYFSGKEPDFKVPLHFNGTDFQNEVWKIN